MGYYHVAQICLNGHCITDSVDSNPSLAKNFCRDCGSATITSCPNCNGIIKGDYDVLGVAMFGFNYKVPAFCDNCGKPYPWTQSAIEAMKELIIEDEELSEIEKTKLTESINDIISETPKTQLASTRVKKALLTAGKFTVEGLRQFVIDFGCELAIKSINLT